jgi:hypothetical protein
MYGVWQSEIKDICESCIYLGIILALELVRFPINTVEP